MVNLQHREHGNECYGIISISYPLPPPNFQEYTNQMDIGTSAQDKHQKPLRLAIDIGKSFSLFSCASRMLLESEFRMVLES